MVSKSLPQTERVLARRGLSGEVANQLCNRIRRRRLSPDAVLGTEAELATEFGVSRTVIREAIGQLRGLGLVKSRQGVGLCVANTDVIETMSKTLVPLLGDMTTWSDLCHMRFVLEVGALPLAVERATSEQIEEMRVLANEMLNMVTNPDRKQEQVEKFIADREIEFHKLVFDAAGSEFASRFHEVISEYFHESYGPGPHGTPPALKDMHDHFQLADAFEKRDICEAHRILVDHIRNILC